MSFEFYYDDDYDQILTIVKYRISDEIVGRSTRWMDLKRCGNLGWYTFDSINISQNTTPVHILSPLRKEVPGLFVDYTNKKVFFDGGSCSILKLKYGITINVRRPI